MTEKRSANWDTYQEDFPQRYWQQGAFDQILEALLQELGPRHLLDVGGGQHGTGALLEYVRNSTANPSPQVFLLDPFVTSLPNGMSGRMQWNDPWPTFDLAVARGSINYLQPQHFSLLKLFMRPGGVVVANTFLNEPSNTWTERAFVNGRGQTGVERSRCVDGVVEHVLEFDDHVIEHQFFYYSPAQWQEAFPGARFVQYGHNSYVIRWEKPDFFNI